MKANDLESPQREADAASYIYYIYSSKPTGSSIMIRSSKEEQRASHQMNLLQNSNLFSSPLLSGPCAQRSYVRESDYHWNVEVVVVKLIENVDINVDIWEEASDNYDNYTVYGVAGCKQLTGSLCKQ